MKTLTRLVLIFLWTVYVTGSIWISIGQWFEIDVVVIICLWWYILMGFWKTRTSHTFTWPIENFMKKMPMLWNHSIIPLLWLKRKTQQMSLEQLLQGQEIWLSYWFFVQTKGWWWCKTFFNFTVYATALPWPCVALSTDMMNSCQLRPSTYGLTLIINKGTHICTKWRKLTWFGSRPYNYDYFLEFIYI